MKFFAHSLGIIILLSINSFALASAAESNKLTKKQRQKRNQTEETLATPSSLTLEAQTAFPTQESQEPVENNEEIPEFPRRDSSRSLGTRSDASGQEIKSRKNVTTPKTLLAPTAVASAPVARVQAGFLGSIWKAAEKSLRYDRTIVVTAIRSNTFCDDFPTPMQRFEKIGNAINELSVQEGIRMRDDLLLRAGEVARYAQKNMIGILPEQQTQLLTILKEKIRLYQELEKLLSSPQQTSTEASDDDNGDTQ